MNHVRHMWHIYEPVKNILHEWDDNDQLFKRIRCKPRRSPVSVCRNVCSSKLSLSVTSSLDVDAVFMLFLEIPLRIKFFVSCCPFVKLYTMSQKCHYFVLLCLWHTWTNFDNFWQKCYWENRQSKDAVLSHLTWSVFCTRWGNKKAWNFIHSLNCCMQFCEQTQKNTLKHHLSQLNQVCHNRGPPCVKNGSCFSSRLESMESITKISY